MATSDSEPLTLIVGTRNYSSWSMRPWLLMRHLGVAFVERDVEVLGKGPNAGLKPLSPSGLVPCLLVGAGLRVWESVAICEFLYEAHPSVWPADRAARAMARAISCEMAAGFGALRGEMPCNIKLRTNGYPTPYPPALARDVGRVEELVVEARERFGAPSGAGPFLFGAFCAADAMYAPVATRFRTYGVELASPVAREYFAAVLADEAFLAWEKSALAEEAKGLALAHYDEATVAKGCGLRA
jgi:glutathione S-transferase